MIPGHCCAGVAIPRPSGGPGPQDPGVVIRHPTLTDGSRLRCTKAEGRHLVRRCRPFGHDLRNQSRQGADQGK
jgi:hypothetical protein